MISRVFAVLALGILLAGCASDNLWLVSQGGVGASVSGVEQKGAVGQYSGAGAIVPRGTGVWDEYYEGDGEAGLEERLAVHVQEEYASTCVGFISRSDASFSLFGVQGTHIAATANAAPGTCETLAQRVGNGAGSTE